MTMIMIKLIILSLAAAVLSQSQGTFNQVIDRRNPPKKTYSVKESVFPVQDELFAKDGLFYKQINKNSIFISSQPSDLMKMLVRHVWPEL